MKIQPFLGTLSGKLGGLVASKNRAGAYLRKWVVPNNPGSSRQTEVRGFIATLSTAWRALIAVTRAEWENFAASHPVGGITLTGLQMYLRINLPLIDAGDARLTTPPEGLSGPEGGLAYVVTFTDASTLSIAVTGAIPSDCRLKLWGIQNLGAAQNKTRASAKLIGYTAVDPTSPIAMLLPIAQTDAYYLAVWFEWQDSLTGLITTDGSARVLYTAP